MTCSIPGICSKSPDCRDKFCPGRPLAFPTRRCINLEQGNGGRVVDTTLSEAHKRGFGRTWDEEQVEPVEAGDGAVLAVLFLGILFLFGVPLFVELVLR